MIDFVLPKIGWPAFLTEFYISICCALASYFVFKKKNFTIEDKIHAAFWFAGFFWWFFNGIALGFWRVFPLFARTIIFFGGVFLGIHYSLGIPYLASKFSKGKKTYFFSLAASLILFILFYFLFLINVQETPRGDIKDEAYYALPQGIPSGYILGALVSLGIFLGLLAFFVNLSRGRVSLFNLTSMYPLFALITYVAVVFPGVLYVNAGHFINVFHLLVPYFMYRAYSKKI
jgi:hypothetical protein